MHSTESSTNKRRSFLKGGAIAAAAATSGVLVSCGKTEPVAQKAPAQTKTVKELKMVTSWPKNFPGLGTAAARFAKRIEDATNGRYKIRVYGGNELVPSLKAMDAVQEGTADMYHSAEYYYRGKSEAFAFYAAVPFGFTAAEMDAWLFHGGGQQLWDEISADFNVKPFACSNTGVQMGGWYQSPITSLNDFKGLKIRMPGLGGDVVNALGGTAISLGGSEIMPALQAGTIDATEWVGPWNDLAFGFYKVVKNYMYPGFHEPGTTLSSGVSRTLWDSMGKEDQAIFEQAALAENNYGYAEFTANNGTALQTLINEHGVQLREMPDDVFKAIGEASADVLATAGNKDATTKRVYDSFLKFHRSVRGWTKVSNESYTVKRGLYNL